MEGKIKPWLPLIIILLISLLVRIPRLDYPFSYTFRWGDGTRDYLVANHIVKYHEFIGVGPFNLLYDSGGRNSPLYFYLLAVPLYFYNQPITLGILNLILQLVVLTVIYLITKLILNQKAALIAVIFYGFNPEVIKHSDYIWQPYLMLPAALSSLYFLLIAYSRNNYRLLLLSMVLACLAFVLHNSFLGWIPAFALIWFAATKKSLKKILGVILVGMITLIILQQPLLDFVNSSSSSKVFVFSLGRYLNNLNQNLMVSLRFLNINYAVLLFFIVVSIYLIHKKKNRWLILFMLLFFLPQILASYIHKIRPHYTMLSLSAFVLWISIVVELTSKAWVKYLIYLGLFIVISGNLAFLKVDKLTFENDKYIKSVTEKIETELNIIKTENNYPNYDFFQVTSYVVEADIFEYPVLDSVLLIPLEEKLNQRLAENSNTSPFSFIQTNKKDYLFVSCHNFYVHNHTNCLEKFTREHPGYKFNKAIFKDHAIEVYLFNLLL